MYNQNQVDINPTCEEHAASGRNKTARARLTCAFRSTRVFPEIFQKSLLHKNSTNISVYVHTTTQNYSFVQNMQCIIHYGNVLDQTTVEE